MRFWKRTLVLLIAASVAAGATMSGTAGAGPTKYESFKAEGTVATDDTTPETPLKEAFQIAAPVNTFGNVGVDRAKNPDGSLDVRAQATTKYYRFDMAQGRYVKGNYDNTVEAGAVVRAYGKYGKIGDAYEVLADTIYQPPRLITPRPPNPACTTVKDRTYGRKFNVVGDVLRTGTNLTNLGIYSDFFGFVLTNLGPTNNSHIAAVAAHDVGNLGVNTILTGEQNTQTGFHVPFTTRYRKQDPTTLKWSESTKDETIVVGNQLQAAGRYGCELNDWRQLAQFVWNPVRGATQGSIKFTEVATKTESGTQGNGTVDDTEYDGTVATGDVTVASGSPFALDNVDWEFNSTTNSWDFEGEWVWTNTQGFGSLLGTVGGSWNVGTGNISGTVILTSGNGRYSDYVGAGSITGSGLSSLGGGPPSTFDATWFISVM